jgi:hypothetical protein
MPYRLQSSVTPNDEPEDKPFRMSEHPLADLNESREMADAWQILSQSSQLHTPSQRNRFFGGICLALPLSAVLWYLVYHFIGSLTR